MVNIIIVIIKIFMVGVIFLKSLPKVLKVVNVDNIIVNNKSECVYRGAGVIKSISIDCDGVDGYIIIYDGDNENGKIISRGRGISNASFSPQLSNGIPFEKGLYVSVNAATTNYVLLVSTSKK